MKTKRPSLPRPESPQRKMQTSAMTPQARPSVGKPNLSKSMLGGPRFAPSPTPNRFGGSVRGAKDIPGDPGKKSTVTPRPAIRKPTGARALSPSRNDVLNRPTLGPEAMFDEDPETPTSSKEHVASPSRRSQPTRTSNTTQDTEVKALRSQLEERDRQLEKYASDLEEMQHSITELQILSPKHNSITNRSSRSSGVDGLDAPSLRALVREKDEKITTLVREFDSHRADFRETIDILEHTADETNRHYEERIAGLEAQLRDHSDREGEVQSVAEQLLNLERHVEELEEGLEDSRRGESEARAEVEHLRGEVERGKAEMRREKEKASNSRLYGDPHSSDSRLQRELAHRDNEVNGLKAIIHSLSRDASSAQSTSPKTSRRSKQDTANHVNGQTDTGATEERQAREKLEREVQDLQNLVDRKTYREEELEHEIQRLRKHSSQLSSAPSNVTAVPNNPTSNPHAPASHARKQSWRDRPLASPTSPSVGGGGGAGDDNSSTTQMTDGSGLWCEMCETSGHDILHCTSMSGGLGAPPGPPPSSRPAPNGLSRPHNNQLRVEDFPSPLGGRERENIGPAPRTRMPNPMDNGMVAGKDSGVVDGSKWCALCERDGHESVDCPFDDDL